MNDVTKTKGTAMSTEVMDDIFESAGEGASFDSSEMQIPFVRLIQALSPQISKKKPEFIEGASQGDAFNTVTKEFWDGEQGLTVVPCFQTTKYLEFVPRESGGGFQGEIAPDDPLIQQATRTGAKEILPSGNELVKSDQHFCLIVGEDGSFQPAIIDMKSTQLKVSRNWKTMIAMQKVDHPTKGKVTPAVFATKWKLSSIEQSNDKGTFANWQVEKIGLVDNRDLLMEAKAFRSSVAAGEVKAAPEESPSSAVNGDEIPF
tara:strand:+ start:4127 stop:4906 length:780 start_codon:yes stop_codon:yes gene_type:complete